MNDFDPSIFTNAQLVVVGSGFYGMTVARLAAEGLGLKVLVIEKRDHIGGNAWSEIDPETGIEVHKFGTHVFHTANDGIWSFVNRFSGFNRYTHHVRTRAGQKTYRMPVSQETYEEIYGMRWDFPLPSNGVPKNLEEKAIASVGHEAYNLLIRGYTKKQWQADPKELPASIINRLPVRDNYNPWYFDDPYQGIPLSGYGKLFQSMADDPWITVLKNTDYFGVQTRIPKGTPMVYSGPLDAFFHKSAGELEWRTLDFQWEAHAVPDYQGLAVMNYSSEDVPYTRIHEFKHLHPERPRTDKTIIAKEFSRWAQSHDEKYYPIPTARNNTIARRYEDMADRTEDVVFGGRLGSYQYLDMHQAIGAAMSVFNKNIVPHFTQHAPLKRAA